MDSGILSEHTQQILIKKGFPNIQLKECKEIQDFLSFSKALSDSVDTNKYGPYVDKQPAKSLKDSQARPFLSQNGMAGIVVWPDGNIGAAFKNSAYRIRYAIVELILTALNVGGNKLDCYNGTLPNLYAMFGFIPVARVKFNPEYAPPNWKEEFGEPDVIFWIHCGDSADTVLKKINHYPLYTPDDLANLPSFPSYEKAYQYRDELLLKRH